MDNFSSPQVFLTSEIHKIKTKKNLKPLIPILLVVLLTASLSFAGYYYRSPIQKGLKSINNQLNSKKVNTNPKIIPLDKPANLISKGHPTLFYADLEYNPKSKTITQLKTGFTQSEMFPLSPNLPKDLSAANFAYKIEVLSPDSKAILQSGWKITFKKAVETTKGTYRFGVATPYKPGSIIKVYLPVDQLIWTGKIQEQSS